jgi:hypothetical protein
MMHLLVQVRSRVNEIIQTDLSRHAQNILGVERMVPASNQIQVDYSTGIGSRAVVKSRMSEYLTRRAGDLAPRGSKRPSVSERGPLLDASFVHAAPSEPERIAQADNGTHKQRCRQTKTPHRSITG